MVDVKSQDVGITFIAALLADIHLSLSGVLTERESRLDILKVKKRFENEGLSFLTKTLPRFGKAFDRALTGEVQLNSSEYGFKPVQRSKLPKFMGGLFSRIFDNDGRVLQNPDATCIRCVRDVLYLFYKYKLPYSPADEQRVIDSFVKTESEIRHYDKLFSEIAEQLDCTPQFYEAIRPSYYSRVIRIARRSLSRLFSKFDPKDIHPKHGPGAVSTKEKLWGKYFWTAVPKRLTDLYPFDAYFCASLGHVCDYMREFPIVESEQYAQVTLVPKDSRGPRLISMEPLSFQWIQQGLGTAIRDWTEKHPLTRENVRFTDQAPNQFGALMGSLTGRYATLDLKEASDRVTLGLVRLLFPEPLLECLMASRTTGTKLPNGEILPLRKFAPMGSNLCFPILSLTVWSILHAAAEDRDTRKSIYVYGDDVIVPTAFAANAIAVLEAFGLLVNRDKSCTSGFFRESCGTDAFKGVVVTPIRFRTVWSDHRSPDCLVSWTAYANQCYDRKYYTLYDSIVSRLCRIYGSFPETSSNLGCPSLREVPEPYRQLRRRVNQRLQRLEHNVWDVCSVPIRRRVNGWMMLLRWFSESSNDRPFMDRPAEIDISRRASLSHLNVRGLSVSSYTKPRASILVRRWR